MLIGTAMSVNSSVTSGTALLSEEIETLGIVCAEETGTLRIVMPSGETHAFQYRGNAEFPCCGEIVKFDTGTSEERWHFTVYYDTPEWGSGSFGMEGDTTDMGEIIRIWEDLFDIVIIP